MKAAKELIKSQIVQWKAEYDDIKNHLIESGDRADSLQYNIQATEALRLTECISDLSDVLISLIEDVE